MRLSRKSRRKQAKCGLLNSKELHFRVPIHRDNLDLCSTLCCDNYKKPMSVYKVFIVEGPYFEGSAVVMQVHGGASCLIMTD